MWKVEYLSEALDDIKQLDQGQRVQVVKAINRVAVDPLPQNEGGYGKPLGKKEHKFDEVYLLASRILAKEE